MHVQVWQKSFQGVRTGHLCSKNKNAAFMVSLQVIILHKGKTKGCIQSELNKKTRWKKFNGSTKNDYCLECVFCELGGSDLA